MPVVIIGAGDHARVVLEGLRSSGTEVTALMQPTSRWTSGTRWRACVWSAP